MIILGIIVALIIFSVVILVHEWGHFYTARKFGVKVEEFGLGIPPRAKKLFTDKKGTLFSLNWLPIGGFVRLYGENPKFLKKADDKQALFNKPAWQQSIIILAGVIMNFLLAIFIFSILFLIGVKPVGVNTVIPIELESKIIPTYEQALENGLLLKDNGVVISPLEGSIAQESGLKEGDIIYEIHKDCKKYESEKCDNGQAYFLVKEINSSENLIDIFSNNKNNELILYANKNLETQAGGTFYRVKLDENGKMGAYIGDNIKINNDFEYSYGILDSIKYGVFETYAQTMLTFKGIGLLAKNIFSPETPQKREEAIEQVAGPIGIVDFISNSVSAGFKFILIISAVISINLGVFNLLPIPALDGGRFVFITLNGLIANIFGRKIIGEQTETIIHLLFFIILIALSLLIGYNDVIKIINR